MAVAATAFPSPKHETGHFVRFYHADSLLVTEIAEFASRALRSAGRAIVIATPSHLAAVAARLHQLHPADAEQASPLQGLVALEAQAALSRFMVDGWPDEERFYASIGALMAAVTAQSSGPVHAFGEMVSVLCEQGHHEAALRLEELWNELARRCAFTLFCAYPQGLFGGAEHSPVFQHICAAHTHVLPSELLAETDESDAHRLVALWQQKAQALEREVERRHRAEATLQAASREKDEFLAMLGHELRNPLSPIVTALRLMRLHTDGATLREQNIIARQVDHLVRLVDDLLDISRITRGKIELKKRTVSVDDVLANAVEMANLLLEQRGHRLSIDIEPDLVWEVDATRLAQVVSNLLTNAARYTATGGHVQLRARLEEQGMIAVSVEDDGMGIAPDVLPRVFELFFQGKRDLDRAEGGLGIGLALVKNLIDMHGGQASAASDGPGHGSTFVVRVPGRRAAPRTRQGIAHAQAPPRTVARRVLLVDDNVDGLEALAELLRAYGHRVQAVSDPAAALEIASQFAPEIFVIDIGLPMMDGYALVHRLRNEHSRSGCLFVALTGYGQDADRRRSREAGFHHHFVKPLDPSRLLHLIDTMSPSEPSVAQ